MTTWNDDCTMGIRIKPFSAVWVKGGWKQHPVRFGIEIHEGFNIQLRIWFGYISVYLN